MLMLVLTLITVTLMLMIIHREPAMAMVRSTVLGMQRQSQCCYSNWGQSQCCYSNGDKIQNSEKNHFAMY